MYPPTRFKIDLYVHRQNALGCLETPGLATPGPVLFLLPLLKCAYLTSNLTFFPSQLVRYPARL